MTATTPSSPFAMAKASPPATDKPTLCGPDNARPSVGPIRLTRNLTTSAARISLTIGRRPSTAATTTHAPRAMFRRTSSATKIWTTTATGETIPITVTSGIPRESARIGRLIGKVIGIGSRLGDGHGSMIRRGAMRHSTTDAGSRLVAAGDGWQGR